MPKEIGQLEREFGRSEHRRRAQAHKIGGD
jgi:hypothetical protein